MPGESSMPMDHGMDNDMTAQRLGGTDNVRGWSPEDNLEGQYYNGGNGYPPQDSGDWDNAPTSGDPYSSPYGSEANYVPSPGSETPNSAVPVSNPSAPLSENFRDDSLANSASPPGTSGLESLLTGDPEQDQVLSEIIQGIQEVESFPVRDDGTLEDDDINDLKDTLKDEEERIEELVDQGTLSAGQATFLQNEIDPLRTGLDRIDEISIDTGDRIVSAGKTVANVASPTAGLVVEALDRVGVLEPVGGFLGDLFDGTIGKIFKRT